MNAARDAFADPTPWRRTSRYLDAITAALELNADASFLSVLRIARIARVTRIFKMSRNVQGLIVLAKTLRKSVRSRLSGHLRGEAGGPAAPHTPPPSRR